MANNAHSRPKSLLFSLSFFSFKLFYHFQLRYFHIIILIVQSKLNNIPLSQHFSSIIPKIFSVWASWRAKIYVWKILLYHYDRGKMNLFFAFTLLWLFDHYLSFQSRIVSFVKVLLWDLNKNINNKIRMKLLLRIIPRKCQNLKIMKVLKTTIISWKDMQLEVPFVILCSTSFMKLFQHINNAGPIWTTLQSNDWIWKLLLCAFWVACSF